MRRFIVVMTAVVTPLACGADGVGPGEQPPSETGRIAFQMRRNAIWDVYTVAANGSDLKNLTRSPEDDLSPAWSRDSRRLAFVSGMTPEGIYIVDADGGGRRLLHSAAFVEHLTWAPDGNRLAFGSVNAGEEIYVINADGTGLRRLTNAGSMPDWSPDGTRILFHRNGDVMAINVDGSGLVNLTPNTSTQELDPVWSPDGTRIAFVSTRESLSVYTMAADGSDWRRVTTPPSGAFDRVPDWAPSGRELVFQRATFPTAQVYATGLDGRGLRVVADTLSGHPSW